MLNSVDIESNASKENISPKFMPNYAKKEILGEWTYRPDHQ